jgi:polysaccharide pyruvyl transferase WcaK-like protein/glycosyltransferase involved in cell wall biosynthesis
MTVALRQQQQGALDAASASYRQALDLGADLPDALHMLGVICFQTRRFWTAFDLIRRALDRTEWAIPAMRYNLRLVLGELLGSDDAALAIVAGDDPRWPDLDAAGRRLTAVTSPRAMDSGVGADVVSGSNEREPRARILVVDASTPAPDRQSGSVRIAAILRLLAGIGCKVTFVARNTEYSEPYVRLLQQDGIEVLHEPRVWSITQALAMRGAEFDAVIVSRHHVASPILAALRRFAPQALFVFDTVDLHYLREEREGSVTGDTDAVRRAAVTREQEQGVMRCADVTLVVSATEQALLAREAPEVRVLVLSNIHEVRGRSAGFDARSDALFVGGFAHSPNVDAMLWYAKEVWPLVRRQLPALRTHVVGSNLPDCVKALAGDGIDVVGHVPDLEPWLERCRISVAPLRYGSGVKGKIGTAQSAGVPVVATSIATEGMYLQNGRDVIVADSAADFAAAIVRLHTDRELWRAVSEGGMANVARHFSPSAAAEVLEELVTLAIKRRREREPRRAFVPATAQVRRVRSRERACLVLVPADYGSLGDEAMVRGLLAYARESIPDWQIDLLSIYGGEPWPRIAGVRDVLTACPGSYPLSGWRDRLLAIAARYGAFAALGADVLDGHYSVDESRERLTIARIVAEAGLPTRILGFSINERPADAVLTDLRALSERASLCVRDPVSVRRLAARGIGNLTGVADLAFLMPPAESSPSTREVESWIGAQRASGRRIMIVSLSRLALVEAKGAGAATTLAEFADSIVTLMSTRRTSVLVMPHDLRAGPAGLDHDVAIAMRLVDLVKARAGDDHCASFVPTTAPDAKRIAGMADLVVTGRMHLAIAALGMTTPVVGIGYQSKFEGLMAHFGRDGAVVDARRLEGMGLRDVCGEALARAPATRAAVAARLPQVMALARANFDAWPGESPLLAAPAIRGAEPGAQPRSKVEFT